MKKILLTLFLLVSYFPSQAEIIELDSRDGIVQKILFLETDNAIANVVLFAGGHGKLNLKNNKVNKLKGNFLIRSRGIFIRNNLNTILFDAPSDKKSKIGMFVDGFRNSKEHLIDIRAVIEYIRQRNKLPIWLIGTSRGTESVSFAAVNLDDKIDGAVITSSISEYHKKMKGTPVTDLPLERITKPFLAIHHKKDSCNVTKPNVLEKIKSKALNSSRMETKFFSGGSQPNKKKECAGKSYHGFLGIESEVVNYIIKFIKNE